MGRTLQGYIGPYGTQPDFKERNEIYCQITQDQDHTEPYRTYLGLFDIRQNPTELQRTIKIQRFYKTLQVHKRLYRTITDGMRIHKTTQT